MFVRLFGVYDHCNGVTVHKGRHKQKFVLCENRSGNRNNINQLEIHKFGVKIFSCFLCSCGVKLITHGEKFRPHIHFRGFNGGLFGCGFLCRHNFSPLQFS